ncbi:bZIP transcription factor 11-like [Mangifera indica]|uniref:bZIP transcription factor 11-like n=1 Tax=Mangifera indica TaxID=29780 RepID=UPI001CFA2EDE|nr:bZIP transcription factor 11-like [Mangifera indica]
MASSSGTSSGSGSGSGSVLQNSGSEEDLRALMDQRKRKRMISNRESARRSRMRKQKHLDDLMAQAANLRLKHQHIITNINITTQHFLNIEAENSVLRAQLGELTHRLQSLNEIISFLSTNAADNNTASYGGPLDTTSIASSFITEPPVIDNFMSPLNLSYLNQPIMASVDMFQY